MPGRLVGCFLLASILFFLNDPDLKIWSPMLCPGCFPRLRKVLKRQSQSLPFPCWWQWFLGRLRRSCFRPWREFVQGDVCLCPTGSLLWAHASQLFCHPGTQRTLYVFWWPSMREDVKGFIVFSSLLNAFLPVCSILSPFRKGRGPISLWIS